MFLYIILHEIYMINIDPIIFFKIFFILKMQIIPLPNSYSIRYDSLY